MKEKILKVISLIIEAIKIYCTIAVFDMFLENDKSLLAFDTTQHIIWSVFAFCFCAYVAYDLYIKD